jgi:cytochrome P450
MLMQDDTYQSYFLPKGIIFLINSWAIYRDVEEFDNPDDFVPERWLGSEFGTKIPVLVDVVRRVHYGFGAGRRYCPGVRLAENSLVRVLSLFSDQQNLNGPLLSACYILT